MSDLRRNEEVADPTFLPEEMSSPIVVEYLRLQALGLARCTYMPDDEPHDFSYVDTWGLETQQAVREKKEAIARTIERYGKWGLISYVRLHTSHPWVEADSLWDVIAEPNSYGDWYSLVVGAVHQYEREVSLSEKYAT